MRRLLSVALLFLTALSLACAVQVQAQRTSPFADDGDLRDWDHYYGLASGRDYRPYLKTNWRGAIPGQQDIAAAADAQLKKLRTPWQYHIGVPLPDGGTSQPNENTPYARDEISWSGIYSMHKPGEANSNVVLLLVCSEQVIEGPTTERSVNRSEELRGYVLDRDPQSGTWSFSNESKRLLTIGDTTTTSRDELMRQFTTAMGKQGYVPGLSDGSGITADSGSVSGKEATSTAGGFGPSVMAGAPPPGIEGIGQVPGPATMGQAIAGVAIPGLVIILVNTLAGLPGGGGAPAPVPASPPAGPPPVDEEAERRARQLKQDEDDLRRVREMKSFLGATAAGAQQAGFNTAEQERKLADLTRQEKELTAAIARAGGDSSYTAAERATNAVGAGFVEANRIAQEFNRQQAIAAARAKMEQLERDRLKAEQDYYKNVREGFWQNTVKDVDAIPGQLREAAKSGLRTIGQVIHDTGKALTDRTNWEAAARAAIATVHDIIAHPVDSAVKVGEVYGAAAKGAARAARHIANNPAETIKSVLGVDNWEKAFDPNVPVTERIARVLGGIADVASTLVGVKQAVTAGKTTAAGLIKNLGAVEAAPRVPPSWVTKGYSSKTLKEARDFARQEQIGGFIGNKRYTITEDPLVKIEGIGGKVAGSKEGLMSGMTEEARKHAQMVTDRYGVKLDIRPTNQAAHDLIKSGEAVPKAPHCKSKTINEYDLHLGADPADVGKAGYFKPREPSAADLEGLSQEVQGKVMKRYKERLEEYKDQAEHIEELTKEGKVTIRHGVVYDGPTGKAYTGDHDLFDIRDATTGRPLSRYQIGPDGQVLMNADGTPKLNPVREQIIKELQQPPMSVQHGAHMDWKYDHLSGDIAPGSPAGTKSDFEIARGIDRGVTSKHQEGGETLITFVSGTSTPVGSWFSGER